MCWGQGDLPGVGGSPVGGYSKECRVYNPTTTTKFQKIFEHQHSRSYVGKAGAFPCMTEALLYLIHDEETGLEQSSELPHSNNLDPCDLWCCPPRYPALRNLD